MRKLRVVVLILFVFAAYCAKTQPKLEMQDEVDWGSVTPLGPRTETQSVTSRVEVKNTGDSVLVISNVRVQCGCTSAPLERDTLAPGEASAINITLNLPAGTGLFSKYVTVFSNDPLGARVLRLKVDVQRPIQLASSFLAFDRVKVGEPTRAIVRLTLFADTTATINALSPSEGLLVVTALPIVLTKGKSADIEFQYVPTKPGSFHVTATLTTTILGYERIELSGYGAVSPVEEK